MDTSQTDLDPLNTTVSSGCTISSGELCSGSLSDEENEVFCEPEIFIDLPKNTIGDFQPILEKMRAEWPDGNSKPFKLFNNPQPLSKFHVSHPSRLLENLEQKDSAWCYKIPGLPVLRACIEHFKADRVFKTEVAFIGTRLSPMHQLIEHCGFDLMVDPSSKDENNKRPIWQQSDLGLMAEWRLVNIHKTDGVAKVIRLTVQAHKQEKIKKSWLIILGDQARIYFLHYLGDNLSFGKSFEMRTKEGLCGAYLYLLLFVLERNDELTLYDSLELN